MSEETNKEIENAVPEQEVKTEAPAEAKTEEVKVEAKAEAPKAAAEVPNKSEPRAPSAESREKNASDRGQQRGPGGQGGQRGPGGGQRGGGRDDKGGKGGGHKKRTRHEEPVSEFIEKVVQVRRVTKVVKGGKKLSFRTTVIIGNEKGKVGVGVGKAAEVLIAIKKAITDARKSMVDVSTVAGTNTISHSVRGIAGGSNVLLKPAAEGTGIIAGGTARIVLELAGVGDILAKSQGSKSPLNVARATVNALGQLRSFQEVADLRGISKKKMLFA